MSKWINRTVVQLAENATNNTGTTSTVNFAAAGAGNLLVAVASGSVTSTTPTGWTLGASAVGSSGHYVWYKNATASESSFSTTHNGGGYPNAFVVYEFPAGSTFVKGAGTNGLAAGTANPTISTLTGTNLLMASVSESYAYTTYNGTGITWPAGTTVDTDIHQAHVTADGYWLGIGYAEDSTATSYGPNPTISDPNGVVASERLTWAIHVNPTITKVATATVQMGASGANNLTVPAGVTSNHLCVVLIADANAYTDTDTVTPPAGWTTQANKPSQANNSSVYIFTKLGGYSAGQTIPFTKNTAAMYFAYAIWYDTQGYDIGVVGSIGGRSGTTSVNTVIPGITTTDANQDVIVVATERTTATGTAISSYTGFTPTQDFYLEDPSASGNTATSAYFGHYTKNVAGATGNLTIAYSGGSGNGAGMMFGILTPKTNAIAVVGAPTTADGNTAVASAAVNVPAGAKVGEILLATITTGGGGASITPPSGWNVIQKDTDTNYNTWWVGWRAVDGTEAASYTWSWTSTTYHMATISRISGTNTYVPIRTSQESWGGAVTSYSGPTLSNVGSTDREFYFFAFTDNAGANQASAPTVSGSYATDFSRVLNTKSQMLVHSTAVGSVAAATAATPASSVPASVGFALEPVGSSAGAKFSALSDNFATQDNVKWYYDTGASVVSGQLSLPVHAAYDAGITTNSRYDLTTSSVSIQIAQVPNVGNGTTEILFHGKIGNNNGTVQWGWGNGQLNAQVIINGNYTTIASIAYNATTTKWLRVRHDGAKVQWDYSADAATWTTLGAGWTPTFPVNNLLWAIYSGYYGTETTPGTALLDNFNITPTLATETWAGTPGTVVTSWPGQWTTSSAGVGKVQIQGGRGQLTSNNTQTFNSGNIGLISGISVADSEATCDFQFYGDNDQYLAFMFRSAGAGVNIAPSAGYQFMISQTQVSIFSANPTQANSGTVITGSAVSYSAGAVLTRIRMRVVGTTLQYKIWPAAGTEPTGWSATVTDSTYAAAGVFGITMSSGNSLVSRTVYLDNLTVTDGSISSNVAAVPAGYFTIWNGTTENAAILDGIYNGTGEIAVASYSKT